MSLDELLAVFVTIVLFVFTIGFLINWYRNRTVIVAYKRIGFWLALIWVAFELLTLALSRGMFFGFDNVLLIVVALGWGILRMWSFVNNGIFFSRWVWPWAGCIDGMAPRARSWRTRCSMFSAGWCCRRCI